MESKKRKFISTAFTLSGTIIGAGILGLPYVFAQSGFFIGLFWLVFLGLVVTLINLYLGEITLRTNAKHQLPGYSSKYLGKWGRKIMSIAIIFGIYSALLAYMIGEGESLSKLFFENFEYSLFFGIAFWALMTFFLNRGSVRRLKNFEFWGVISIFFIIFILSLVLLPDIQMQNVVSLRSFGIFNIFLPFGIVLFALLGFDSVPEMRLEIGNDRKMLKKAIFLGTLIPIILYILFSFVFVGVLGQNAAEVATLSFSGYFGKFLFLLGIFTMSTSFFVLSFALKDYFIFDLKKRKISFFYVSFIPLIAYLLVSFFDLADFVTVLGVGGAISGGMVGILVLFMNIRAKKKGDRNPEYSIPINWFIIAFLSLIFLAGIFFQLF
jgi:tyrosine-specific transport protein